MKRLCQTPLGLVLKTLSENVKHFTVVGWGSYVLGQSTHKFTKRRWRGTAGIANLAFRKKELQTVYE